VPGFWSLVTFRHEQKGQVAQLGCERATIQRGTRGCATGLPTELRLTVILPVPPSPAGFPEERQVLFQGMWWLQVL